MNRFEQAVYDCMNPTAELLEQTTKPLHRAMLLNFWRHVHLEGAGRLRADRRAGHDGRRARLSGHLGANPVVDHGQGGCRSPSIEASARPCCGTRTIFLAVGGLGDLPTSSPSTRSPAAPTSGRSATRSTIPDAIYHVSSRQAFIWPYDRPGAARRREPVRGQDEPRDRGGGPAEAITAARVREIHEERLAKLEAERGERFWVLDVVEAAEPSGPSRAVSTSLPGVRPVSPGLVRARGFANGNVSANVRAERSGSPRARREPPDPRGRARRGCPSRGHGRRRAPGARRARRRTGRDEDTAVAQRREARRARSRRRRGRARRRRRGRVARARSRWCSRSARPRRARRGTRASPRAPCRTRTHPRAFAICTARCPTPPAAARTRTR